MSFCNRIRVACSLIAATICLAGTATAQTSYFGRNKVQHKEFKFEVLKTEHFDIYFYPEEREAALQVSRMAERWRARLSQLFEHSLTAPQPIVLYASSPDFQQTNVVEGIGEGTGGVTESLKRRVVLPMAGTLADTDHVLGHELVHAFQYDIASRQRTDSLGSALEALPLWFIEGMAEYFSIGHIDPHTAMWVRDASRQDQELPTIRQLNDSRYFPYRWGQAFWAYVAGRWGDQTVRSLLDAALQARSTDAAFKSVLNLSAAEISKDWHEAIRAQYQPVLNATERVTTYGHLIAGDEEARQGLNVSPSLSPDGRRFVYFSQRGLLSVDLYLADAETGRIIRKLINTAIDPHFTSLQFIGSVGSWHPQGRQFVFGAISSGRPELTILDVDRAERVREIPFADLGEILNPSWSPDGRFIVFSATKGGFSDLYIYDLDQAALRPMTSDAFAELQPAWSPDGKRVAFVTDRFSTDLSTLHAGSLSLAVLDVTSGQITALKTFERGKSINPQWHPDGRQLYFLSDQNGITNLYVVDTSAGQIRQLTNLDGGASGVTALSPALSSSLDARRIAFSAYDSGQLKIYVIDGAPALTGTPPATAAAQPAASVLPPAERATNQLAQLLSDPNVGLPKTTGDVVPYSPRLSLDFVGQPYLSAGINRFGPALGGGLSFLWSDMLGDHVLGAAFDVNTYGMGFDDIFKNTGAIVGYENRKHRWNWGVALEQLPYITGGIATGVTTSGGQLVFAERTIIQRQTFRGLNGAVAYPFSQTRRLELGGGFQQVSFDQEVRTILTSLQTGRQISDQTETTSLAGTLRLGTATAALVSDNSLFGATSPVAGQRSRLSVSPTVGTISYTGALVDFRRYFMPVDFYTIAGRILHYGRYGSGGEDPRLIGLFLGYPELLRGYEIGSFTASECVASSLGTCEVFDRLIGSRILVGNLEFRFPLLRPFGVRGNMYGPVPVEVAFFADGGVAWTRDDRPSFAGGNRRPVSSAGVTLRANVFGFAVAQIDLAYPFQRPGRGWVWGFSLTPGF
jgi:Tol biopolymer transport system component